MSCFRKPANRDTYADIMSCFRSFMEQFDVDCIFNSLGAVTFWAIPYYRAKIVIWAPNEFSKACNDVGLSIDSWRVTILEPYKMVKCYLLADPELFPILKKIIQNYESL